MPYIGRHLDRGNYLKLDDISSSFDGVETTFNLTNGGSPFYPGSAFSILVVLAGVIQEAESAYQIDQSQITFASAPLANDSFFCIVLGTALGINVPGNGTVGGTQLTKPFSYDGFFYLNDTTNRVGINSSSPTTALDVQGTVTATEFVGNLSNTSGISTFYNLTVENDLTVNGSFSTLDTIVTEVDKLEVGANNSTVGVAITQSGSGDILRLYDSSTQVVTVADGGNVGIGTDNPGDKLHVSTATYGGALIERTAAGGGVKIDLKNGNGNIRNIVNDSSGILQLQYNSSNQVVVNQSGNVGIGTDNPTTKLYIRTDDGVSIRGNSGSTDAFITLQPATGGRAYNLKTSSASFELFDASANTSRMYWNYDGRTGINTASPGTELHVHGTNGYAELRLSGQSGSGGSLEYYDHTTKLADIFADSSSNIIFRNTASNSERLRINSSGNVGIGTDDPFSTNGTNLEVAHHTSSGSCRLLLRNTNGSGLRYYIQSQNDGALTFGDMSNGTRLRINSNGNVGINTTADIRQLEIYNSSHATAALKSDTQSSLFFSDDDTNIGQISYMHSSNYMYFRVNDEERLRITSDGKIGIGTDNPGQKLQVQDGHIDVTDGTAHSYSFSYGKFTAQRSSSQSTFEVFQGGYGATITSKIYADGNAYFLNNVGINTTTPADTLDVNGNVLPSFDATHDLGSASKRWNNVYTTDLQLSNEGSSNDVDGSWGRWTIQEGEDDLFLINRRNGKKYKFVLQEVN